MTADGVGSLYDFMPVRDGAATDTHEIVRVAAGGARDDAVRRRVPSAFRLRPGPAHGRDHARRRRPPRAGTSTLPAHRRRRRRRAGLGPRRRRRPRAGRDHADAPGRRSASCWSPGTAGAPRRIPIGEADERVRVDGRVLARAGWTARPTVGRWRETVHRSAMSLKLMTYAPDRGARRRADRRAARAGGRRAELGLPLHLDPGRLVLGARAAEPGLHRGGRRVRALAGRPGRRARRAGGQAAADHVPGRRDPRPRRGDASTTWRATADRARSGSATAPPTSSSSTSSARRSTRCTWPTGTPSGSTTAAGARCGTCSTGSASNWDRADEGVWETRGGQKDFVYGRLMSWVAFDRGDPDGPRAGPARRHPALDAAARRDLRPDHRPGAGTRSGRRSPSTWAATCSTPSLLLMPRVGFVVPEDPMWQSTLRAVDESLVSDGLVFRYDPSASPDGLAGTEGTFSLCSFWYVDALARSGRLGDARTAVREDADLRQPPRPLLRGDRCSPASSSATSRRRSATWP